MGTRRLTAAVAGAAALAVVAAPAASANHADLIPAKIAPSRVTVGLQQVATGLTAPVWGISAPGDRDHLYVVDQPGKVWSIDVSHRGRDRRHGGGDDSGGGHGGGGAMPAGAHVFADVSAAVGTIGCFGIGYDERGLLGIAFAPDYRKSGLVYTYHAGAGADEFPGSNCFLPTPNHEDVVTEWRVPDPKAHDAAVDPASARVVLTVAHPQFNHDGGSLAFGPDGMLYIGIGDGGNADDQGPGHAAGGNGQSADTLLGKILRIDPRGTDGPGGSYGIPASNPLVGVDGRDEIWAWGFRNPYRFSFDGDRLLVADVGQNDVEEIDEVVRGGNYGWPVKEGTFLFAQDNADGVDADGDGNIDGQATTDSPGAPAGLIDPIAQYDHDEGIAIVGGFVYRGSGVRELRGKYVFGDYSRTFPVPGSPADGRVFALGKKGGIKELRLAGMAKLGLAVLGFARDARGELYVLASSTGNTTGETGVVLRVTRARHGGHR